MMRDPDDDPCSWVPAALCLCGVLLASVEGCAFFSGAGLLK